MMRKIIGNLANFVETVLAQLRELQTLYTAGYEFTIALSSLHFT